MHSSFNIHPTLKLQVLFTQGIRRFPTTEKTLKDLFLPCIKVLSSSREHPKPHTFIISKEEVANLYVLDEHLKQEKGKEKKKKRMSVQRLNTCHRQLQIPVVFNSVL